MAASNEFVAYKQVMPGHDFTVDRKSQPYTKPPKYTELDDVVNFYAKRLFNGKHSERLNYILSEYGIPVNSITRVLLTNSVAGGIHNIFMSMCVAPIVREMVIANAEIAGVDYTLSMTELQEDKVTGIDAEILAMRMGMGNTPKPVMEEPVVEEPQPMGLISRPEPKMPEEGML